MSRPSLVEEIFLAALERPDSAHRATYLDGACRGDSDVRAEVERLLEAHPAAGKFLEPLADRTADFAPRRESAGSVIGGRYKLLEPIGEGGMGSVWMAQQTEPVRRQVALKLIKAGMDTKAVLARFEAERQALALMDHPNIARVFDAGASDEGRPFFVMELVKGVPITRYCDRRKLTLRQRLDLFIPVCQAVQHAHQKGVIHRDLKPSNVLVAQYDDHPVPKVIDFGVAKAAGQPLTDRTLVTGFGAVVGTPEYMSPEQAQFNQLDVDTRSDIYALGVLLYELLTGSTPVTRSELEKAGLLEVLRLIREQDPPRPSTRLSTAQGLPKIAADRGSEPRTLAGLLRNDLDWIVMKSLEKDRNRRYETATGLAADVRRYLDGEAVQAHPPSAAYRVRKFVRKHRVAIATASAFVGLLIASVGISAALALKARRAEVVAEGKRKEVEEYASKLSYSEGYLRGALDELTTERDEARLGESSVQIDLALDEIRTDRHPETGILHLVQSSKGIPETAPSASDPDSEALGRRRRKLREFATMAVLARGQDFAPLRPPLTHDGAAIRFAYLSSTGTRLVTLGVDKTARLWEPTTGRPLAVLRRADEAVIEAGFSPDGATAFTNSPDGVVRLWNTKDGTFRAETRPRPDRLKLVSLDPSRPIDIPAELQLPMTQLSNDRVLTGNYAIMEARLEAISEGNGFYSSPENGVHTYSTRASGVVELWDAGTGGLIGRLEPPDGPGSPPVYWQQFSGDARWVVLSYDGRFKQGDGRVCQDVFSAETGRHLARFDDATLPDDFRLALSPSGNVAGTLSWSVETDAANPTSLRRSIRLWDTKTWRLRSATLQSPAMNDGEGFQLLGDDLYATNISGYKIFRLKEDSPIAEGSSRIVRSEGDLALLETGQLLDTRTWRRLQPPPGRKYRPEIVRFAPDGRFLAIQERDSDVQFIDPETEKSFPAGSRMDFHYLPKFGWILRNAHSWMDELRSQPFQLDFLPPSGRLDIPPDLLELWAQVAVRGHLDDAGAFVPWDEPTWEKKRRELAERPAPDPDFPFPGHLAHDRLHWLRKEYGNGIGAEKPRVARLLLERAEDIGDKAEAARWRRVLVPKPAAAK